MVLLHNKSRGVPIHFSAPDAGGGSGASASGQDGGGEGGGEKTIATPFDDLPWDELSDEDRPKFEAAKQKFVATLQSNAQLATDLEREKGLAKQFQSKADILEAERKKLALDQRQSQPDPVLEAVTEELLTAGYDKTQADTLAPVFAKMFGRVGAIQKEAIGKDLQPMGQQVLQTQATEAFRVAVAGDAIGVFQTPEIQQKAWDFVQEQVKNGSPVTPEVIQNIGKMLWVDHISAERVAGREVQLPTPQPNRTVPALNTVFTFPGAAGITPIAQPMRSGNDAKTALDPDTRAALTKTFKAMGADTSIYPKEFKQDILTPRRRM